MGSDRVLEKLNDYIQKGPIAAMREKILASMGLTDADLKALPPDKQQAVEAKIAERIKDTVLNQQIATGAAPSIGCVALPVPAVRLPACRHAASP